MYEIYTKALENNLYKYLDIRYSVYTKPEN